MKLPVYPSGYLITALPEWQHSQTRPTQHFLHRSSKTPKWEKSQEPYLSFLLSIAPLEIMKPPSITPFPKLRIPNQIHQRAASLLFPGPESMAEWIPSGRSLGGKGYVQAPPPHCRLQCPSQVCYIPSFSWLSK